MLTLEIPFDGVGGQAGLPENRDAFPQKCEIPSRKIHDAPLIPPSTLAALDQCVMKGLALDPNDRFPDRTSWLRAFDELLFQFREGSRLGFFGRWFLKLLDRWIK